MRVIWQPQARQRQFMERPEYEALYGGAAGGGKSDALLAEALRQVHIPHYRGLIVRKSVPQLSELVDRSQEIYKRAFPEARYNDNKHVWSFPSGAKVYFGSLFHKKDKINYQGKRYDFVGVDELTHFAYDEYMYLMSRNRPGGPGTRVYLRATTNPGGLGHDWVKSRFITPAPALTRMETQYNIAGKDGERITQTRARIYVPATVYDNQILLENDPMYLANLAALPQAERDALLYGSWNSFDGQVFREFVDDPDHYADRLWTHVIEPFRIPRHWRIYRGFDWGYSAPFSVGWYAVDEEGRIYRIRELYGCTEVPNTGVRWNVVQIAAKIREIEEEDENLKGRKIIGIADPAIFANNGGQSAAELMARPPNCVYFDKGDHARVVGKMQMHYRMAFDDSGVPMMYVFRTSKNFIRTITSLIYDTVNVEDVDSKGEDHAYDEFRYVMMENPITPRPNARQKPLGDDPLDLRAEPDGKYRFYRV